MRDSENSEVPARSEIKIGQRVWAIEKRNYGIEDLTEGVVKRILTGAPVHSRGIKVVFEDGTIARVQRLTPPEESSPKSEPPVDFDIEGDLR